MVEFDDPFHEFMEQCLERKGLKGQSREVIQDELRDCVEAWNRVKDRQVVDDVDEEELAERFIQG